MPEEKTFQYEGEGTRLDQFLAAQIPTLSRTYLQKLIKNGHVRVNGQAPPARRLLKNGDAVRVFLPDFAALPETDTQSVPLLFEDKTLIVVDKPAGLVVHPVGPQQTGTLVQLLWPKLSSHWGKAIQGLSPCASRPGVVHRLDRGTSGVMVIAKTPRAAELLSRQFADRSVQKIYRALVEGIPATIKGRVQSSVGRSRRSPHLMSVTDPGRDSETEFTVISRYPLYGPRGAAHLEIHPLTGRTHQIRLHMSALGHPIIGDPNYGATYPAPRPMLHALSLEFTHPVTGKRMKWQSPLPPDFTKTIKNFKIV